MYLKKDDSYMRGELKSKRGSFDDQHKRQICAFRAAGFSQIDFLSKRAGYDGGQERAHGGLELCDQERQKDLQGQRAAGRRRQGLVFGYLELLYVYVTYMTWAAPPKNMPANSKR